MLLKYGREQACISHKRKRVCEMLDEDRLDMNLRAFKSLKSATAPSDLQRIDSFSSFFVVPEHDLQPKSRTDSVRRRRDSEDRLDNLSSLPQELILKTISFLGPRSNTLVHLSLVDKRFQRLMTRVGAAALARAKANFRILLPKLNPVESNLCLFMRHSQSHHEIQSKCQQLKKILRKDFVLGCCFGPIIVRSLETDRDQDRAKGQQDVASTSSSTSISNNISAAADAAADRAVSTGEIDSALDIALELMGQDVISYFLESCKLTISDVDRDLVSSERRNIIQHCAENLEFQVLSLAGQCGAKVYKYIKMQQAIQGCWDMDHGVLKPTASRDDVHRMDRARLLMQLVICRDFELARKDAQLGFRRKRLAIRRNGIIVHHDLNLIHSLFARFLQR